MQLDKGFCTVYSKANGAPAGNLPADMLTQKFQSWYGELEFGTTPDNVGKQQETQVSARIRILQNRAITTEDVAILSDVLPPPGGAAQYDVIRAFHGKDEESGELITDLSLREVKKRYDFAAVP